ncbi:MAG: thioredoxin-dependent peroxiredoxin [Verrucomicrobiota bacterium]|jgi:thioredoxin-dependent peroxiredoxin
MKLIYSISTFILFALPFSGRSSETSETNGKLSVGDPIPAVAVLDQDGKTINLAEAAKNGYTLVYFYPKAMTPGCTAQACSLRDAYQDLQQKGVKIYGVSLDTVDAQKEFQTKESLPFELLSDTDHKVTAAFGVPLIKNSFATRQAYLFKDGRLVWLDTKASTDKQAADVLVVLSGNKRTAIEAGNKPNTEAKKSETGAAN